MARKRKGLLPSSGGGMNEVEGFGKGEEEKGCGRGMKEEEGLEIGEDG